MCVDGVYVVVVFFGVGGGGECGVGVVYGCD